MFVRNAFFVSGNEDKRRGSCVRPCIRPCIRSCLRACSTLVSVFLYLPLPSSFRALILSHRTTHPMFRLSPLELAGDRSLRSAHIRGTGELRASAAGRLRPARLRKPHPTPPPDYHRPTEKRSAPRLPHPIPNHPLQPPIRNRISPYRVLPKLIRQAPTGRNRVGLLTIRTGLFAFPPKEHPSAEESYQQLPSLSTARNSAAGRNC